MMIVIDTDFNFCKKINKKNKKKKEEKIDDESSESESIDE